MQVYIGKEDRSKLGSI